MCSKELEQLPSGASVSMLGLLALKEHAEYSSKSYVFPVFRRRDRDRARHGEHYEQSTRVQTDAVVHGILREASHECVDEVTAKLLCGEPNLLHSAIEHDNS